MPPWAPDENKNGEISNLDTNALITIKLTASKHPKKTGAIINGISFIEDFNTA
jgi:hypothetical protein